MWQMHTCPVSPSVAGASISADGIPLCCGEVLRTWRGSDPFCHFWVSELQTIPFEAYCWETPPLTRESLSKRFECVFVDHPALARAPADASPFAEHLRNARAESAVVFENLGQDALLVAPLPEDETASYAHLAAFHRTAPAHQASRLWRIVAETLEPRVSDRPLWLSTAGLGVDWLHVRIDSRPKYYRYRPYASSAFWDHRP